PSEGAAQINDLLPNTTVYGLDVGTNGDNGGAPQVYPPGLSGLTWGTNSYAANYLVFGALAAPRIPDSMPDGTSKTIFFTEKTPICDGLTQAFSGSSQLQGFGGNFWAFPPFFPETGSTMQVFNYAGVVGYNCYNPTQNSVLLPDNYPGPPPAT